MKKWIVLIVCTVLCGLFFYKAHKRGPIIEPIVLNNTAQIKLDLQDLEKVRQNNAVLPRPIGDKRVVKPIQNPQKTDETESSIQVEQELLWQEDENKKEDNEEKSSFSRWFKQKIYGIKMKLKLPF